jgi:cytochrome P450
MEARVFFEEFFRYFEQIESTGEPVYIRSNMVHGFKKMPVHLRKTGL